MSRRMKFSHKARPRISVRIAWKWLPSSPAFLPYCMEVTSILSSLSYVRTYVRTDIKRDIILCFTSQSTSLHTSFPTSPCTAMHIILNPRLSTSFAWYESVLAGAAGTMHCQLPWRDWPFEFEWPRMSLFSISSWWCIFKMLLSIWILFYKVAVN
jgi:hypothetical protein